MSDLSDSSSTCWEGVLGEAQRWYRTAFVPASPVQRLRLKLPNSMVDEEPPLVAGEAPHGALGAPGLSRQCERGAVECKDLRAFARVCAGFM